MRGHRALPIGRLGPGVGGLAIAGLLLFGLPVVVVLGGAGISGSSPPASASPSAAAAGAIPPDYLALYESAAARYGVDWAILAAMGERESGHGQGSAPGIMGGVNFAGCCAGPMQFDVTDEGGNTWAAYGLDGNGDGARNVYDPADAIPAAAHYLQVLGGDDPDTLEQALARYGGWGADTTNPYVDAVLEQAARYRAARAVPVGVSLAPSGAAGITGLVFPVRDASTRAPTGDYDASGFASPRSRGGHCPDRPTWHCAIDIFAPTGTPLVSPISGRVENYGWDNSGGWRLWVAAGEDRFYLAHLAAYAEGIAEGVPVQAGQLIGFVGTTGSAQGTSPHLHIAWEHAGVIADPYPLLAEAEARG